MENIVNMGNAYGITLAGLAVLIFLAAAFALGLRRGLVRELISLTYYILVMVLVWLMNPYMDTFLAEHTGIYKAVEDQSRSTVNAVIAQTGLDSTDSSLPEKVVEQLPLPGIIKDQLKGVNGLQAGQMPDAASISESLSLFLAKRICNGISLTLTWIMATILVKILSMLLNTIVSLPLLNEANKLGGGILGGLKGLAGVWFVMLVLTLLYSTELGQKALKLIEQDVILSFLYDRNLFIKIFLRN